MPLFSEEMVKIMTSFINKPPVILTDSDKGRLSGVKAHVLATFSGLGRLVVDLAEQLLVLHQVELVTGVHLPIADDAGEAVHVVDVVLRSSDHVGGRDPRRTCRTLRAVKSA